MTNKYSAATSIVRPSASSPQKNDVAVAAERSIEDLDFGDNDD
jgi:hypothetical protein